jgi:integrase
MQLRSRRIRGQRWFYAWCKFWDGARRRGVLRATGIRDDGTPQSRQTAEVIGWQIERSLAIGGEASARKSETLKQALTALTKAKRLAMRSDATIEIIADKGMNLAEFFGETTIMHTITKEHLVEYATEARKLRSVASLYRELLVFRQACEAVGVTCPELPDIGDVESPPQRTLDVTEMRMLIHAVPIKRKLHVLAYLQLGLRKEELWKITDVDWTDRYVYVNGTKTKKAKRWVPIPDELFEAMEPMRAHWNGFEPWTMLDRDLRKAADRAGLGHDLSTNDLRGTYAHHMAVAGVPQLQLAKNMGTSVKMLDEVYARLDKRGEHQHAAVARGVPRLRPMKAREA